MANIQPANENHHSLFYANLHDQSHNYLPNCNSTYFQRSNYENQQLIQQSAYGLATHQRNHYYSAANPWAPLHSFAHNYDRNYLWYNQNASNTQFQPYCFGHQQIHPATALLQPYCFGNQQIQHSDDEARENAFCSAHESHQPGDGDKSGLFAERGKMKSTHENFICI